MNPQENFEQTEDSISLTEILSALMENKKLLISSVVVGVLIALVLCLVLPNKYEASTQIEIAKVVGGISNNNNIPTVPVEDANLLVMRLQHPTTYTKTEIAACGLEEEAFPNLALSKLIKATVTKKMVDIIEISARHTDTKIASNCLNAIFMMVANQEQEKANVLLAAQQKRLQEIKQQTKTDRLFLEKESEALRSIVYLAKRDEVLRNLDEISRLELAIRNTTPTRLISSIYISDEPVSPKTLLVFSLGIFGSLCLAIVWIFGQFLRKQLKTDKKQL